MSELDHRVQGGLARVGEKIRAAVEAAVAECAAAIAEQARADCPVRSGRLRESISVEVATDPAGAVIEGRVFADAPYAAVVELGTGKSAPQPFLFPALERLGPIMLRELLRMMAQRL
jgi:HK97 gp10 family phage protein